MPQAMLQDLGDPTTLAIVAGASLALIALAFIVLLLPASDVDNEPLWMLEWIQVKASKALDNLALRDLLCYPLLMLDIIIDSKDQLLAPLMRLLFGWDMYPQSASSSSRQRTSLLHRRAGLLPPRSIDFQPFMNEHHNATMMQDRTKITSRAQLAQFNNNGQTVEPSLISPPAGHLVRGLVNTGNSCFLNSVLQALSSLDLFLPYLETLLEHSEALQVAEEEVQVTEALADTLQALQQPISSFKVFRPRAIVEALGNFRRKAVTSNRGYHSNLMNREQQDAQELFQLISSALSTEELFIQKADATRPVLDVTFLRNLVGLEKNNTTLEKREERGPVLPSFCKSLNPLSGLLASRLSCMQCGYTEAIRHFTFDNLSLSLPSTHSCHLEDCLREYVTLESLHDVVCRKCSLQTTLNRVKDDLLQIGDANHLLSPSVQGQQYSGSALRRRRGRRLFGQQQGFSSESDEADRLSPSATEDDDDEDDYLEDDDDDMDESEPELTRALRQDRLWGTHTNTEQLRETLTKQLHELERALKADVEAPLPDIKLSNVVSRHSTKQVMLARPPPVLCLHFIRSQYSMYGTISKNGCHVRFPEYLNLSPFCTTGVLLTRPNLPISVSEWELGRVGLQQNPAHPRLSNTITPALKNQKKTMRQPRQYQQQHQQQHQQHDQQPRQHKREQHPASVHESEVQYVYRLQSIIVHYGGHSYGHFIAYRRKPESMRSQVKAGNVGLGLFDATTRMHDGEDWFRISDETVESVSLNQVLGANPYMLLYERVVLPGQDPTPQHQQAVTHNSSGASLLTIPRTWSRSIVQAVGLSRRKMEEQPLKQEAKLSITRLDGDALQQSSGHGQSRKEEGLYHALHHPSRQSQSQSSRDGEDMSDMESLQSLDDEDEGGRRRGGWRSFVSSPNSTTPPSPDTGTSTCSSPASSSLASPVMRQRTQLARGLQKRLSDQIDGCVEDYDADDDIEAIEDGKHRMKKLTEMGGEGWMQRKEQQQQVKASDAVSASLLISSAPHSPSPSPAPYPLPGSHSPPPTPFIGTDRSIPTPRPTSSGREAHRPTPSLRTPSPSPDPIPAPSIVEGKNRTRSKKKTKRKK